MIQNKNIKQEKKTKHIFVWLGHLRMFQVESVGVCVLKSLRILRVFTSPAGWTLEKKTRRDPYGTAVWG